MHSLNLVYTFRAVPLIELCNGMTIGNVLLCVCRQFISTLLREEHSALHLKVTTSPKDVCVCVHSCMSGHCCGRSKELRL